MATAETMPLPQEGHSRGHQFRKFMKRLTKMKSSDSSSPSSSRNKKISAASKPSNGAIPQDSTTQTTHDAKSPSSLAPTDSRSLGNLSKNQSQTSLPISADDNGANRHGARSTAPTIATQPGTTHSDAGRSKAGTFTTGGGATSTHEPGGEGSTFSSPAPSVRSLTTTLTTIQSGAPGHLLNNANAPQSSTSTHFTHQYPTTPTPASAIPPHVVGQTHGTHHHTYNSATANNLLTDDASVLTLASSTKRRRRNSLDTNASVKALAPSSVFGGSRESLPLSVLSANISGQEREIRDQPSQMSVVRPNMATAAAERASIYSNSANAEGGRETRSSYYANRGGGDGASVRSGLLGHGRSESITGSIGGQASPLASPTVLAE